MANVGVGVFQGMPVSTSLSATSLNESAGARTQVASLVTGILAGAMPALRAGRADLTEALKEGGRNDSAVGVRTRRLLIVGEVALSLVLLMGATVMVRSLLALRYADTGFNPRNVLTMRVALLSTSWLGVPWVVVAAGLAFVTAA